MAETQGESVVKSTRRWYQFSTRTMIIAVAVICVLLAIASGSHRLYSRHLERKLYGATPSERDLIFHNILTELTPLQTDQILSRYAEQSSLRAWIPEREIIFDGSGVALPGAEEANRHGRIEYAMRKHHRRGAGTMGLGVTLYSIAVVEEDIVELEFAINDYISNQMGVAPGEVWRARMTADELLDVLHPHAYRRFGGRSGKLRWFLDHSTATSEVETEEK